MPDGDNTNITIQTLDSTTWRSVLSLRVPGRPGVIFERYFISVDNGVDTFAISENDAPQLIRAGKAAYLNAFIPVVHVVYIVYFL